MGALKTDRVNNLPGMIRVKDINDIINIVIIGFFGFFFFFGLGSLSSVFRFYFVPGRLGYMKFMSLFKTSFKIL